MKKYFTIINLTQQFLLILSIAILAILPSILALSESDIPTTWLYSLAHGSLFFVMIIRPLADLLPQYSFIRPLVILRKGVGVFSSAIIVSFIISKLIIDPTDYLSGFSSPAYWSITNLALFAHLADIAAVLLLVTSNNLSKRILGKNWKRIQRLSYVYFYGSGLYVTIMFGDQLVYAYLIIVTLLTTLAFLNNHHRRTLAKTT